MKSNKQDTCTFNCISFNQAKRKAMKFKRLEKREK